MASVRDKLNLMILGVDIGGTKTLLGCFDDSGTVQQKIRFETPKNYSDFIAEFRAAYDQLEVKDHELAVIAAPGKIARQTGVVERFGNLPWTDVPVKDDLYGIIRCETYIENDAKLAGLSEAIDWDATDKKVLYITVSTGIGTGVIDKGVLDETLLDSEGGHMLLPYEGKLVPWEDFGSGRAITARYGKKASEITDESQWKEIAENLTIGIIDLCAVIEPDLVIIGGGVGTHFAKYQKFLEEDIKRDLPRMITLPEVVGGKDPEMAALKGCYAYAKQKLTRDR